jgi:hypothetical protein
VARQTPGFASKLGVRRSHKGCFLFMPDLHELEAIQSQVERLPKMPLIPSPG